MAGDTNPVTVSIIRNSYAIAGAINGMNQVGGLVGNGFFVDINNSYAIVGAINEMNQVGGLVGNGQETVINNSYAITGAINGTENVGGLIGTGTSNVASTSYWDNDTSGRSARMMEWGEPQSTHDLRSPTGVTGIYSDWPEGEAACGWDFGTTEAYPALLCLPISPAEQRALYLIDGTSVVITRPE